VLAAGRLISLLYAATTPPCVPLKAMALEMQEPNCLHHGMLMTKYHISFCKSHGHGHLPCLFIAPAANAAKLGTTVVQNTNRRRRSRLRRPATVLGMRLFAWPSTHIFRVRVTMYHALSNHPSTCYHSTLDKRQSSHHHHRCILPRRYFHRFPQVMTSGSIKPLSVTMFEAMEHVL
jgi:hypothetical protein